MRRATAIGGLAVLVGGTGVIIGQTARAQNVACIEHYGFADATELVLRRNAAITRTSDGDVLRLTPALGGQVGAAFSTTAFNLTESRGLDTTFQFRITEPRGNYADIEGQLGADGFALLFVAATEAPPGTDGAGIAYDGIPNSVAVEFDTYANKPPPWEPYDPNNVNDPNGNHVGVHTRGTAPNSALESAAVGSVATDVPNLSDGQVHTARVVYQPPSGTTPGLRVFVDGVSTPVVNLPTFNMATTINLGTGQGFLGFTSSTGGSWENHDILSWTACTFAAGPTTTVPTGPTSTSTSTTSTTRPTSTTSVLPVTQGSNAGGARSSPPDALAVTGPAHQTQLWALLMLLAAGASWFLGSIARRAPRGKHR